MYRMTEVMKILTSSNNKCREFWLSATVIAIPAKSGYLVRFAHFYEPHAMKLETVVFKCFHDFFSDLRKGAEATTKPN